MSLNCLIHLCMVLCASVTLCSSCSGSIQDSGSLSQLSCQRSQSDVVVHKSLKGWKSFTSFCRWSYCNTYLHFIVKKKHYKCIFIPSLFNSSEQGEIIWPLELQNVQYLDIVLLDGLSFTYTSDRNPEQTFSGVEGLSHCLALLKLLACTPHLVGHLMGMINVSKACKPSNLHLETQLWRVRTK